MHCARVAAPALVEKVLSCATLRSRTSARNVSGIPKDWITKADVDQYIMTARVKGGVRLHAEHAAVCTDTSSWSRDARASIIGKARAEFHYSDRRIQLGKLINHVRLLVGTVLGSVRPTGSVREP